MKNPELIYAIRLQPKTGRYSLRDSKAMLLGTFDTFEEAEQEASLRFPKPRQWRHA